VPLRMVPARPAKKPSVAQSRSTVASLRSKPGTAAYDDAGKLIMVLYERGISDPAELARALKAPDLRLTR
jgi:hypothetical protein